MTRIYLTIAWIGGIVAAREWGRAPGMTLLIAAVLTSAAWLLRPKRPLAVALAAATLLGAGRYILAQPRIDERSLAAANDHGWATVWGYVSAEPSERGDYTQLEIAAHEVEAAGERRSARGKLVCNAPLYPRYEYGDAVCVQGVLETPPVLDDFDYREYLAARGVLTVARRARVTALGEREGSIVLRYILRAKAMLRDVIERILPYPDAGLLTGVLLGSNHALSDDLSEAFRAAGLTHLVVVSGYNVGFVAQWVTLLAGLAFRRRLALWASLGGILFYAALVGPSAPVMRAALMGGIVVFGQIVGRRSHTPTALAAATLAMTAINPLQVWSVSFQLSFAATWALIALAPRLESAAQALVAGVGANSQAQGWRLAREFLFVTLAAQIATLPLIWYHFGEISLVALLANALVLPAQPPIMALGALAVAAGCLWTPAGQAMGWLAWPLLRYTILVVRWLGALPWASISTPQTGSIWVWAFYGTLVLVLWGGFKRLWQTLRRWVTSARAQRALLPGLALVAALVWAAALSAPDGKLHAYFLDVGQGDAILIRTPGGRTALIDGGADPTLLASRLGQILPFWQRRIDLVAATHADADHLTGLIPLVERYRVGQVLESPAMGDGALAREWHAQLAAHQIVPLPASAGLRVEFGPAICLEVLHPLAEAGPANNGDDNANSLAMRLTMDRCQVLLTGDIDAEAERALLRRNAPLAATILKVAHHGSGDSSSPAFLEAVAPQTAIISVGNDNRFGHPAPEVIERIEALDCRVWRTDEHGTVEIVTDGQMYWVKPQRP